MNFTHGFGILASNMDNALKFIQNYADLINTAGFYVFFWGLLVLLIIVVALLFEKERLLLPGVVVAAVLVSASAFVLETRRPILDLTGSTTKMIFVTREVKVPAEEKKADEEKESKEEKKRVERYKRPRRTTPRPEPKPKPEEKETKEVKKEDTEPERKAEPKEEPETPPSGERTEEGLVLPQGDLTINITSTLLLSVPREATKASMLVYYDGKYVGGKGASKLRRQKNDQGEVINVTYFWEGATIRLKNQPTGNHRVRVVLKITGNGVNKSVTAWSGTMYIGEGSQTAVLKGGWGNKLQRIQ